jgi:hypothetical protein
MSWQNKMQCIRTPDKANNNKTTTTNKATRYFVKLIFFVSLAYLSFCFLAQNTAFYRLCACCCLFFFFVISSFRVAFYVVLSFYLTLVRREIKYKQKDDIDQPHVTKLQLKYGFRLTKGGYLIT